MTLQQLRYIIALDEERHFARAAESAMISQPGLTIQLKNLEAEIGVKIFDRTKVPLVPTEAGTEILQRARMILLESDALRNFIIEEKETLEGTVTIGVIPTLAPYLIPEFLKTIIPKIPKMRFVMREMGTGELLHDLHSGKIDMALMATPTGMPNVSEFPVFQEPFLAYLNDSHSELNEDHYTIQPSDRTELLLLEKEFCYNAQLLDICGLSAPSEKKTSFHFDVRSIETLKNLVKADMGFAIVPELSVTGESDGHYKRFTGVQPVREISLVTAHTFTRKKLLEIISETLWDRLPDSLKKQSDYRKIRWNDSPYFVAAVKKFSK